MWLDLAVGVVVLGLLIYRQLIPRPVSSSSLRLSLILGVIGLIQVGSFLQKGHSGPLIAASLAGSLVLAAGFGAGRAATVRIWLRGGQAWSQGSWLTALLWVAALAAHLGYDALLDRSKAASGLGTASIVLYLAVSLAVQRVMVQHRARLAAGSPADGRPGAAWGAPGRWPASRR